MKKLDNDKSIPELELEELYFTSIIFLVILLVSIVGIIGFSVNHSQVEGKVEQEKILN